MKKTTSFICLLISLIMGAMAYAELPEASQPGHISSIQKKYDNALDALSSELVTIPAGSFRMGRKWPERGSKNEKPRHTVTIKAFKMGKYEVTQAQWQAVMNDNPSEYKGDNRPVENVSWDDIQLFLKKLNAKTGLQFRLPSEAEWEYAARAGTNAKWSWGRKKSLAKDYAWFSDNANLETHPVGKKRPNAFGLYDMQGNVWEWVQDCWNDSYENAPNDGHAWETGTCEKRVLRGGYWNDVPKAMRSAFRVSFTTDTRYDAFGFRLVLD